MALSSHSRLSDNVTDSTSNSGTAVQKNTILIILIHFKLNLKRHCEFNSFATKERNGLLLYNGRYNDLNDFIALELVNGRVQFSYSLGAGPSTLRLTSKRSLADGNWHTITINYVNRVKRKQHSFFAVQWDAR